MQDSNTAAGHQAQPLAALHGKRGEDMACRLLIALGYTVLARNIRHRKAEMDVLAQEGGYLVCIEVKTRTNLSHGRPEEYITRRKQELLNEALVEEVNARQWAGPSRFDEVALVLKEDGYEAEVFRDVRYD